MLHSVDLHLEPNEASDLAPVHEPGLLAAHRWDAAYLTVLDEPPVEDGIVVLGHEAGRDVGEGWSSHRLSFDAGKAAGRSEDAEAVCVRPDGVAYVLGSHYGSKDGPLQPKRQWLARFDHGELDEGLKGARPSLEVVRTKFRLHRAVNDALATAGVPLVDLHPRAREALVVAARRKGEDRGKGWAERVHEDDLPLNIEGARVLPDGGLLLGLRYPTTRDGQPLLVELADVDALFAGETPRCGPVWWLEGVGAAERPVGVRGLDGDHVVVGNLDSTGKDSVLLEHHPEGGDATCAHWHHEPLPAGGGPVAARLVHDFAELKRVEGVAPGPGGHHLYVVDEESRVDLRFLLAG